MWEINEIAVSFPGFACVFAYIATNIHNSGWDKIQMVALGLLMDSSSALFPCYIVLFVLLTISPLSS